jgi:hypothetical protein
VASGTGTYKKTDWAFGGLLGAVGGGAYTSTDEGKLVAGALLDNYNTIVKSIVVSPSLLAPTSSIGQQNANASLQATVFSAGDVLTPKINNLKVYKRPGKTSETTEIINKVDEVVYLGESSNGFLYVQGADIEGWVQGVMLR